LRVSALPEALPLALAAAVYPPALLVLLLLLSAGEPRRLVAAYLAGAATVTVGAGLLALGLLSGVGLQERDSHTASGTVYIVVGVVLLAAAAWAWSRRAREPSEQPANAAGEGRLADWSHRALASRGWAAVLGLAMYLPSPLYLLAVKDISDSGGSTTSQVLAVLICALAVMLFVEIPMVALLIWPTAVASGLERVYGWLSRNGWTLAAVLALAGGVYAIVKGLGQIT
jgi:hypothetical protein